MVENDTLRIVLSRIGGVIREVVSKKDGRILLRDQEVLSRNWVSTRKNPLRTIYDPGASISVRQTAAGLHVKFRSIFQGNIGLTIRGAISGARRNISSRLRRGSGPAGISWPKSFRSRRSRRRSAG
ncbi:MAG: hypothetical protein L6W00_15690 [Lentisphaeria bacterium]|nr:MAG: hypothetical protein L6W00_15690 [Lentisphaeria bacterium]